MEIFTTSQGLEMLLRWGHLLAGVAWIGLLYYFNFVQMEYMKVAETAAKNDVLSKLAPKALWWFRWAAVATVATGLVIIGLRGGNMAVDIKIGALLGIIMFLNVWLIIWPNQRKVIASAEQILAGGQALPDAAEAGARAALASRTNCMFSVPMLFFMASSAHFPHAEAGIMAFLLCALIILALEYNAAYTSLLQCASRCPAMQKLPAFGGKMGVLATIPGVIHCGLGLTVVLFVILELAS